MRARPDPSPGDDGAPSARHRDTVAHGAPPRALRVLDAGTVPRASGCAPAAALVPDAGAVATPAGSLFPAGSRAALLHDARPFGAAGDAIDFAALAAALDVGSPDWAAFVVEATRPAPVPAGQPTPLPPDADVLPPGNALGARLVAAARMELIAAGERVQRGVAPDAPLDAAEEHVVLAALLAALQSGIAADAPRRAPADAATAATRGPAPPVGGSGDRAVPAGAAAGSARAAAPARGTGGGGTNGGAAAAWSVAGVPSGAAQASPPMPAARASPLAAPVSTPAAVAAAAAAAGCATAPPIRTITCDVVAAWRQLAEREIAADLDEIACVPAHSTARRDGPWPYVVDAAYMIRLRGRVARALDAAQHAYTTGKQDGECTMNAFRLIKVGVVERFKYRVEMAGRRGVHPVDKFG